MDMRVPHNELWFRDGNVVLVAESTCFRVHGSILSRSSAVFRDMLELATPSAPSDDSEMMEGCPIVPLTDTASDLAVVLSLLYNGYQCYVDLSKAVPFTTVQAMVTLGYKYQLDDIRLEGIKRLETCFPQNGNDFHNGVAVVQTHDAPDSFHGGRPIKLKIEHAVSVIALARKFDLPQLLPAAIYTATQLSIDSLLDAFMKGALSSDDLRLLLVKREAFVCVKNCHFWNIWDIWEDCSQCETCASKLWECMRDWERGGGSDVLTSKPDLLNDKPFKCIERSANELCSDCADLVLGELKASRDYRWDYMFRVDST